VFLFTGSTIIRVVFVLATLMVLPIVFAWGLYYPEAKAAERAAKTDLEFPFFAAYMTAMAYGGVSPEKLIERLTQIRVFKALREEALRILRDVKIFGQNILSSLERNALWHPSRLYRDFMLGYLTTLRTGGDVIHYLEIRTQEIFQSRMEDLKNRAERVGFIVEAYAAVAALGTLSFYIFFIISGLVGSAAAGGFGGTTGIMLYSFVVLPLLVIMILVMLSSLLPSQENIQEPYAYLFISAPAGLLVALGGIALSGGFSHLVTEQGVDTARIRGIVLAVGLGLIVVSLGPAIIYIKKVRKERAISRSLANFFRDLSEVRRTGLSPEKSIIMLSERDYGPLTPIIKRIAGALSIGLHVEKAVRHAIRGYRNWVLRVTMRFLVDAMEVGGGNPHTLDSLARYISSLVEINEQLRKRLRAYIIMPYFGAIMVAVTSILTLTMLVSAVAKTGLVGGQGGSMGGAAGGLQVNITPENIANLLLIASLASIFNAWLSGLVAGKIQDQSLAAGFLHAALLTAITMLVLTALLGGAGAVMTAAAK
jgi:flagellar protein FlaJ